MASIQTARFKPGANLPGYASAADIIEGRFVAIVSGKSAEGDYSIGPAAANSAAIGVAETSAEFALGVDDEGRRCNIVTGGVARVTASGAITAGAKIGVDAAGKAKTAAVSSHVMGIALSATAVDGDIVEVLLGVGGAPLAA